MGKHSPSCGKARAGSGGPGPAKWPGHGGHLTLGHLGAAGSHGIAESRVRGPAGWGLCLSWGERSFGLAATIVLTLAVVVWEHRWPSTGDFSCNSVGEGPSTLPQQILMRETVYGSKLFIDCL